MLERGRQAGVLVPLFSMPSTRSWGIGELPDLAAFAPWLHRAGLSFLQLLPLNELPAGQRSPYAALSAMALDPIYLAVEAIEDFAALGGEAFAAPSARQQIARLRAAPRVEYGAVRRLKMEALRAAFDRFYEAAWRPATQRARELAEYIAREAWWLDEYALYRAIQDRIGSSSWTAWPAPLKERRSAALAQARSAWSRDILFYQYLQWQAERQWRAARDAAAIAVVGDLPFAVSRDSADVWARQEEFDLAASVGTPPDAFSATGQRWGLPPYRWDVVRQRGFTWLAARAARAAALFDACRLDHVVGFYRTYVYPAEGAARFEPPTESEQLALGEEIMHVFRRGGLDLIAEDLGTVPDFVRASLARLRIPGYRVFRWEREWHRPGRPYRDPATYPALSVATTATHDMTPTAVWWDELSADERAAVAATPSFRGRASEIRWAPFTAALRDALLELLLGAGSRLVVFPIQDVFGWRDQINVPATDRPENWTYRLPWLVDRWLEEVEPLERAQTLRRVIERHDRCLGRSSS